MSGNNVHPLFDRFKDSLPSGTEPPDNGDMEQRVTKLEDLAVKTGERLVALEKSSALILQKQEEFARHFATKADVEAVKTAVATSTSTIIKWVVGAVVFSQLIPVLATWLPKILGPTP